MENRSIIEGRPFLKWVGGKGKLVSELIKSAPAEFGTYFEPFLGGGALFFALKPKKAVLNDLNDHLMTTFEVVKNGPQDLIQSLMEIETAYYAYGDNEARKAMFLRMRGEFNEPRLDALRRASLMIFLNKTCFNGMYRENSGGKFNVPFGKYLHPTICDTSNLEKTSVLLRDVRLISKSFERAIDKAKKGDFVYFDPPYMPISKTSSFTSYYETNFALNEQIGLRNVFVKLAKRGVFVMASNSYCTAVAALYSDFNLRTVMAGRSINSRGDRRGKIREYIITNY